MKQLYVYEFSQIDDIKLINIYVLLNNSVNFFYVVSWVKAG